MTTHHTPHTDAVPGVDALEAVTLVASPPREDAQAVGYVVFADRDVPPALGLDRAALERAGLSAKVGSTVVIPSATGPDLVAIGAGEAPLSDTAALRDIAAALMRAASRSARLALVVEDVSLPVSDAAAAIAEGAVLARYRYTALKSESTHTSLDTLTVSLGGDDAAASAGLAAGLRAARATVIARDVTNAPPGRLTATDMAAVAVALGERYGFAVEAFDKAALTQMGCGGILGVNQGSAHEPRMIKLTYTPADAPTGHLGLVGKGIMYDSGGISLKPSDPMHLLMKMDMGGAAAVLGAMCVLRDMGATAQVTGWLMCTDNMPSGGAYKLGDVLVARNGTTVEVKNTDAEGRLVMMDAIALANEEGVDAIIDIATLTGAALMALGQRTAPVFANNDQMAARVQDAAAATGEPVWRLPLEPTYRAQLDSDIADISNLGGKYAGATTAALFLEHFVGTTPWAHLDIAGTMQTEKDDSWRTAGATGFGARILAQVAATFTSVD